MTGRTLTPEELEILELVRAKYQEAEEDFAHANGTFTMGFAHLEFSLNDSIGVFLGLQTYNMTVMLTSAIRNVSTRIDIASSIVNGSRMSDDLRAQLVECITEIADMNGYRNWLLHGTFQYPSRTVSDNPEDIIIDDKWIKTRARTEARFRYQSKDFTSAEIHDRATRCRVLATTITTLSRQFVRERQASQEKSDEHNS